MQASADVSPRIGVNGKPIQRARYTDKFRASCVLMLEAAGYPENKGSLTTVARHNRIPLKTLHRWATGQNNPPYPFDVVEQRQALTGVLEDIAHAYTRHTLQPDVIDATSGLQAMTTAAIAIDKLRILQELSTEATTALREYQAAASMAGVDGLDMLRRMTARLNAQAEANEHAATAMIAAPAE